MGYNSAFFFRFLLLFVSHFIVGHCTYAFIIAGIVIIIIIIVIIIINMWIMIWQQKWLFYDRVSRNPLTII